jgi:hypothetical protein
VLAGAPAGKVLPVQWRQIAGITSRSAHFWIAQHRREETNGSLSVRRNPTERAFSANRERVSPSCASIHLHRIGRHPPAFLPRKLNPPWRFGHPYISFGGTGQKPVPTFVRPMYAYCSRNSEISETVVR